MATFQTLPNEMIYDIAQYLVPTRCDDLNLDVLAFRAVERHTWHLANELAFARMTVFIQDAQRFSRFSDFCQRGRLDAAGRDMRKYVKEVRIFVAPHLRVREVLCGDGKLGSDHCYVEHSRRIFRRLLQLEDGQDLDASQNVASHSFWEVCIKPYINGPPPFHEIQPRITKDLARLPNVRAISIDVEHHFPDTSSNAWRTLDEIDLTEKIYDNSNKRFRPLQPKDKWRKTEDGRLQIGGFTDGLTIDYSREGGFLKTTILKALPSSITEVKCGKGEEELIPEDVIENVMIPQITEFDASVDQQMITLMPRLFGDAHARFPNLKTLRLRSGLDKQRQYGLWGENSLFIEDQIAIIPKLLRNMSELPRLETLHVDGYVMNRIGLTAILGFAAYYDLNLVLENIMFLTSVQSHAPSLSAIDIHDYWLQLSQLVRVEFTDYMSSGRVQLRGATTCVSVCMGPRRTNPIVVEHRLSGSVRNAFQDLMQTGEDSKRFRSEISKWTSPILVDKIVDQNCAMVLEGKGWGSGRVPRELEGY